MSNESKEKASRKTVTKGITATAKGKRKAPRYAVGGTFMSSSTDSEHFTIGHTELLDSAKLIAAARQGLKPKTFYDFARKFQMTEKTLAGIINLSSRTISNYKEKNKLIEPTRAEHLLKLNALYSFGELMFGNIDEFNSWLNKPFWKSKEETPMSWLITPGGVDLVMKDLQRLAEGYPL
jgi:uncharacterized protein (DUF2384 family)